MQNTGFTGCTEATGASILKISHAVTVVNGIFHFQFSIINYLKKWEMRDDRSPRIPVNRQFRP